MTFSTPTSSKSEIEGNGISYHQYEVNAPNACKLKTYQFRPPLRPLFFACWRLVVLRMIEVLIEEIHMYLELGVRRVHRIHHCSEVGVMRTHIGQGIGI